MRHPPCHRRPAVFVATVLLVFAAPEEAPGQSRRVAVDAEASDTAESDVRPAARRRYGPLEVVRLSILGSGKEEPFTPLLLRNLFTDGWDEPWIAPPEDSDMPRRQGWVNAPDGLFFRNLVWLYQNTEGISTGQDANFGLFQFQSPLSRRLWISIDVPFVTTLKADNGSYSAATFGDFDVQTRVMLRETRRLSIIAGLLTRAPTGSLSTLSGLARINPNVQFWADLGNRWSMRGGLGVDAPLNNFDVLPTNLFSNIAIGQTVTEHDRPIIGDFQYYVTANMRNNLSSAPGHTFFSLTPGFRTHLGGEYFLAGGFEIPLTGPHPYGDRLTFFFVKGF